MGGFDRRFCNNFFVDSTFASLKHNSPPLADHGGYQIWDSNNSHQGRFSIMNGIYKFNCTINEDNANRKKSVSLTVNCIALRNLL